MLALMCIGFFIMCLLFTKTGHEFMGGAAMIVLIVTGMLFSSGFIWLIGVVLLKLTLVNRGG